MSGAEQPDAPRGVCEASARGPGVACVDERVRGRQRVARRGKGADGNVADMERIISSNPRFVNARIPIQFASTPLMVASSHGSLGPVRPRESRRRGIPVYRNSVLIFETLPVALFSTLQTFLIICRAIGLLHYFKKQKKQKTKNGTGGPRRPAAGLGVPLLACWLTGGAPVLWFQILVSLGARPRPDVVGSWLVVVKRVLLVCCGRLLRLRRRSRAAAPHPDASGRRLRLLARAQCRTPFRVLPGPCLAALRNYF